MTTDERMRRLTRDAAQLGADADRARLLIERVRAGELAPERLALAAALGHPLACRALGRARAPGEDPARLVGKLEVGPEALARLALAAARLALSRPAPFADVEDDLPRIHARVTEWVRSGCAITPPAEPRRQLVTVKLEHGVPLDYRACYKDGVNLSRHLARVARGGPGALEDAAAVMNGARRWATKDVAALARDRRDWIEWWADAGPAAGRVVVDALRHEVAPWALGEGDPLG